MFHIVLLYNDKNRLVFKATEDFEAGVGLIQCYPSHSIFTTCVCEVPIEFHS